MSREQSAKLPVSRPTDLPTDLASLIRELRQHLNLSQRRFAAWLKVSVRTVNRWENGHTLPSSLALRVLEEKLRDESFSHHVNGQGAGQPGTALAIADALKLATSQTRSPLGPTSDETT